MGRPFGHVPYPRNPVFTGREDVLADLRKRLTKRGSTALAQAISGLGGIGKTQTAVEYAYRYRDKYQAVLWLNAESPLALKTGCGELARRMQLPHPEDDLDQAVLALKHWLETHTGWLLVLDNADDPAMLRPFLPDAEHGHILITSRAQDFQDLGILNPVELEITRRGRDRIPAPSLRPSGCRGRGTRRGRGAGPRTRRTPARVGAGGGLHHRDEEPPSDAISKAIAVAA